MKKPTKTVFRQDASDVVVKDDKMSLTITNVVDDAEAAELEKLAQDNRGFTSDELPTPFIKVLQPLSPAVQEGNVLQVPGAKPGMFLNTMTNDLYDGKAGINVVAIYHHNNVTEWIPRGMGGGLVKNWQEDAGWMNNCDPAQRNEFNPITRDGHTIVKAKMFWVYQVDVETGAYLPGLFNFTSTKLSTAKHWSSLLMLDHLVTAAGQRVKVPDFEFVYNIRTEFQSNTKGSWHSLKVEHFNVNGKYVRVKNLPNGNAIYESCKTFRRSLQEGTIKAGADVYDNTDDGSF